MDPWLLFWALGKSGCLSLVCVWIQEEERRLASVALRKEEEKRRENHRQTLLKVSLWGCKLTNLDSWLPPIPTTLSFLQRQVRVVRHCLLLTRWLYPLLPSPITVLQWPGFHQTQNCGVLGAALPWWCSCRHFITVLGNIVSARVMILVT